MIHLGECLNTKIAEPIIGERLMLGEGVPNKQ